MLLRHATRALCELKPLRTEAICEASQHPLGDIQQERRHGGPPDRPVRRHLISYGRVTSRL
jgi:hypothetical protein